MPTPPTPPVPPGSHPHPELPPRPAPGATSSGKVEVPREDLHPKIKAGAKVYGGVLLAGIIAAVTAAQQGMELTPALGLALAALAGFLPLIAGFLKAGDGR